MEESTTYLKLEREQEWRTAIRSKLKTRERTQIERVKMNEENPQIRNKIYKIRYWRKWDIKWKCSSNAMKSCSKVMPKLMKSYYQ